MIFLYVLFTPCFPKFSNNITIIFPHFAISSSNFNVGSLVSARAIDGDYFQGLRHAGKHSPGRREKFRREWTLALSCFINTKSHIILLQLTEKYLFYVQRNAFLFV